MSLVAGLRAPNAGTLTLEDQPLTAAASAARRNLGLVPQSNALFMELTAEENLRIFGELQGLRGATLRARLDESVRRRPTRGPPPLHRENLLRWHATPAQPRRRAPAPPPNFSSATSPPVGGRSAVAQRDLRISPETQSRRRSRSFTQTHYMEEAERLCSRIGIIDHGKILALGTLRRVAHAACRSRMKSRFPRRRPPLRWSRALRRTARLPTSTARSGSDRTPTTRFPRSSPSPIAQPVPAPVHEPTTHAGGRFLHLTGSDPAGVKVKVRVKVARSFGPTPGL